MGAFLGSKLFSITESLIFAKIKGDRSVRPEKNWDCLEGDANCIAYQKQRRFSAVSKMKDEKFSRECGMMAAWGDRVGFYDSQ